MKLVIDQFWLSGIDGFLDQASHGVFSEMCDQTKNPVWVQVGHNIENQLEEAIK